MSKTVVCPNCFQKNIVPDSVNNYLPACRKCNEDLSLVKSDNKKNYGSWFDNIVLAIRLVALGVAIWYLSTSGFLGYISSLIKDESETSKVSIVLQEMSPLMNGTIDLYTNQPRVAPLEIETSGSGYYLVKLVTTGTDDIVMTIFIHAGQSLTTEVPLGSYDIKYASGEKWYGYEDLFGAETEYSKANSVFYFQDTGYQISGYNITLYQVTNGNLSTSEISASEF
ncbi:hypothetical protein [Psychrobacter sp. P11G5]|uniref:hypothetical protein n=1 Tax=Psychrobacter sp. P11G5 TaxID=1699624 RepID=UPI00082CEC1F|nr:hypothetical protein [Psychrobacter sp. P11G5]